MLAKVKKAPPAVVEACTQRCMFAPCLRQPVELCMAFIQPSNQTQCLQGFSNSQEDEPSCDPQNPMLGKAYKVEE